MIKKVPPTDAVKSDAYPCNGFNFSIQLPEKEGLEKDYVPAEHRSAQHTNSSLGTLANLLICLLGTGTLAMPVAFKNAGLLFGTLGTIAVGIICTHGVSILVQSSQTMCLITKRPSLGFSETAEKVFEYGPLEIRKFSNFARKFIDTALICTYFGSCCVYIVFIADSVQNFVEYRYHLDWNIRIYIAIVTLPLIFIAQIRQLKYLVPFSAIANVFVVITIAICLYYIFSAKLEFSDKPLFSSVPQLPVFFSTAIFAVEAIGVIMPTENAMRKPQHFLGCPGVLNTAMIIVVSLITTLGFFGYVRYGDNIQGSITLNLAQGESLADTARILMAMSILCTYSVLVMIPIEILWRVSSPMFSKDKHTTAETVLRSLIVIVTGVIAAAAPELTPFISLVGAVFFSTLGLMVPALLDSIIRWPGQFGKGYWILWKNIGLAFFGICALLVGSLISIKDIIKIYTDSDA